MSNPCKHGFGSNRSASGRCIICARANGRKNYRKHKEKIDAKNRAYAKANPDRIKKHRKAWQARNPEYLEYKKVWHKNNRDKMNAYWKAWAERNPDELMAQRRRSRKKCAKKAAISRELWRERNRDKSRSYVRNRRARLKAANGHHSAEDIAELRKLQSGRCAYCRISLSKYEACDHIIPLSKGGSNDRRNLQLVCLSCNSSKHDKMPEQHARSIGRLL